MVFDLAGQLNHLVIVHLPETFEMVFSVHDPERFSRERRLNPSRVAKYCPFLDSRRSVTLIKWLRLRSPGGSARMNRGKGRWASVLVPFLMVMSGCSSIP